MRTESQINASRANAQHSTGPRTPDGKATVSQNARKHGLSAKYVPLSDLERPHFEELEAGLRAEVNPKGPLQESVFRELVAAAWKRDTVNRLLAECCGSTEELYSEDLDDRVRRLQRHKNDIDRAFNRALRQLKELQTTEMLRATALFSLKVKNPDIDPKTYPGMADYAKVTKQSRACAVKMPSAEQQFLNQVEEEAKLVDAQLANLVHKFPFFSKDASTGVRG